jgi:hypothetical protein
MNLQTVVDVVRMHFGEDPSVKLADSLTGKPIPRLAELREIYLRFVGEARQDKPPNTIRPCLYLPMEDIPVRSLDGPMPENSGLPYGDFKKLLLYCHSISFEDRLGHAIWQEHNDRPALQQETMRINFMPVNVPAIIAAYAHYSVELIEKNIIMPIAFDPRNRLEYRPRDPSEPKWEILDSTARQVYEELYPSDEWGEEHADDTATDLQYCLAYSRLYGVQSDIWLPSRSHIEVLRKYLINRRQVRATEDTLLRMLEVSSMELPALQDLSESDIVAIRRNEEIFASWRDALSTALDRSSEVARTGIGDYRQVLLDSLQASQDTLKGTSRSGNMKHIFTKGAYSFSIGAMGTGVAALAFGPSGVRGSLVAGAVAALGASAPSVASRIIKRREQRALSNHFAIALR